MNKLNGQPSATYALIERHLYDLIKRQGSEGLNKWVDARVAIHLHKTGRMFKRRLVWPFGMGEPYKCILTRKQLNTYKRIVPTPQIMEEFNNLVAAWKEQQAHNPNLVIL